MKKTFRLCLLLAMMVAGTVSAWANDYYREAYSAESDATGWTTSVSERFTPVILEEDGNYFLSVDQDQRSNNGCVVTGSVLNGKVLADEGFTMTFDLRLSNSSDQEPVSLEFKNGNNDGVIFSLTATAKEKDTWKVNGQSNLVVTLPNSGAGKGISDITWCSYTISRSGELTFVTITNRETQEVILERTLVEASHTGGLGNIVYTTRRYNSNFAIDNIVVRFLEEGDVPVVTPTTYTLLYRSEEGDIISPDVTLSSVVGLKVSASSAQTAPVYYDDWKYLYKEGNDPITLQEDATQNIITLTYRKAEQWNWHVRAQDPDGNILKVLKEDNGFEQDVVKAAYPLYILKEGLLYTRDATNKQFYNNFVLENDNFSVSYVYRATETDNVVFLTEGEDIEGATIIDTGNSEVRSSNAASAYAGSTALKITSLPAGRYVFTAVGYMQGGSIAVTNGSTELLHIEGSKSNWVDKSDTIALYAPTTLYLEGGSKNAALDYLYIQQVDTFAMDTWDFSQGLSDATIANMETDETWNVVWNEDGSLQRVEELAKHQDVLTANGEEIAELEGLLLGGFALKDKSNVVFFPNRFRLARPYMNLYLPQLEGGQTVTVRARSANADATDRGLRMSDELTRVLRQPAEGLCPGANVASADRDADGNYTFVWQVYADIETPTDMAVSVVGGGMEIVSITINREQDPDAPTKPAIIRFTAPTQEGVDVLYHVVDYEAQTCEVFGSYSPTVTAISTDVEGTITIPAEVTDSLGTTYKVVGIGGWTFRNTMVSEVVLPDGITYIGESAFRTCNIAKINLPEGIDSIGDHAFYGSNQLLEVTLPSTLKTIKTYAFNNNGLILVRSNMTEPCTPDANAFASWNIALFVPEGTRQAYLDAGWTDFRMILDSSDHLFTADIDGHKFNFRVLSEEEQIVETFPSFDFPGCRAIDLEEDHSAGFDLIVPSTATDAATGKEYRVVGIGHNSFANMWFYGERKVVVPEGVRYIEQKAFYNNFWVRVELPSTLQSIGSAAFGKSWQMQEMKVPFMEPIEIVESQYDDVGEKSSATLYVVIGTADAFREAYYWNLFGDIVEYRPANSIWSKFTATTEQGIDMQFYVTDDDNMKVEVYTTPYEQLDDTNTFTPAISFSVGGTVVIPSEVTDPTTGVAYQVTAIGSWAFRECTLINNVVIPSTVNRIGASAFRRCTSLTSVNIPEGIQRIEDNTFFGCPLSYFSLPASVNYIGDRALQLYEKKLSQTAADQYWYVVANMAEPAQLEGAPFGDAAKKFDLYVPAGSKEAYTVNAQWAAAFQNIFEIGQSDAADILGTNDLTVKGGEQATLTLTATKSIGTVNGYNMNLILPEGLTIATGENGQLLLEPIVQNDSLTVKATNNGDGSYLIEATTTDGSVVIAENGEMFHVTIEADKVLGGGVYTGRMENIVFSTDRGIISPATIGFTITVEAVEEEVRQSPIFADDVEADPGMDITLPISLNNDNALGGFLFQLTLPKGFTVPQTADGQLDAQLLSDYASVPLMAQNIGNNTYRFFAFDMMQNSFPEKAGHVMDIKVSIPLDLPAGDYTVKMTTVKFQQSIGNSNDEYDAQAVQARRAFRAPEDEQNMTSYSTITVKGDMQPVPGDVNGDYKVNATDVARALNIVATGSYEKKADVNNDNKVDIADILTILKLRASK